MRPITSVEELKQVELGILLAVDRFCTSHGIKYSLADGTLIGAIRHHGFIPWDDDIDIYMERADYERFEDEFPEVFEGKYKCYTLRRDKRYGRPYGRVCDVRTLEKVHDHIDLGLGLGIDIFPVDEVPDDENQWLRYNNKRYKLYRLYMKKAWVRWDASKSLVRNLSGCLFRLLMSPISFRKFAEWLDRIAQSNNGKGYRHLFETSMGIIVRRRFLKDDFAETIPVSFEGHQLQAMKGYDHYLRAFYGDYMQLPPEEKRVSHHVFTAYWLDDGETNDKNNKTV